MKKKIRHSIQNQGMQQGKTRQEGHPWTDKAKSWEVDVQRKLGSAQVRSQQHTVPRKHLQEKGSDRFTGRLNRWKTEQRGVSKSWGEHVGRLGQMFKIKKGH